MDPIQNKPRRPVLICGCFFPEPPPLDLPVQSYASMGHAVEVVPWRLDDMADIVGYAQHIAARGRKLAERSGAPINIVAHSMGGVAALYAIKRLGLGTVVSRLVTFGTPFCGTPIAYTAFFNPMFFNLGLQLVPNSSFLNELTADPLPPGVRVVSIAGATDRICSPSETLLAGSEQRIWPFSHTDFMFSMNMHQRIDQLLE